MSAGLPEDIKIIIDFFLAKAPCNQTVSPEMQGIALSSTGETLEGFGTVARWGEGENGPCVLLCHPRGYYDAKLHRRIKRVAKKVGIEVSPNYHSPGDEDE